MLATFFARCTRAVTGVPGYNGICVSNHGLFLFNFMKHPIPDLLTKKRSGFCVIKHQVYKGPTKLRSDTFRYFIHFLIFFLYFFHLNQCSITVTVNSDFLLNTHHITARFFVEVIIK